MSNLVKGKNVVTSMFIIDTWYPIFCAKSGTFERVQDEIEVTSINSGSDKEFIPGMRSATLSMTGVTTLNNTNARISVLYLDQQSRSVFQLRTSLTDNDGNNVAMTYNAIIKRTGFSRDVSSYSQSFVDFRITGAVTYGTIISPPAPPAVFSIYIDAVEGQTSVSSASLDGVTVKAVARSGQIHRSVSGTPGNMEFRYTDGVGTGTISFDPTNPFLAGEVIYVLYVV